MNLKAMFARLFRRKPKEPTREELRAQARQIRDELRETSIIIQGKCAERRNGRTGDVGVPNGAH